MRQFLRQHRLNLAQKKAQLIAVAAVCHPQLPLQTLLLAQQHAAAPRGGQTGIEQVLIIARLRGVHIELA
jgi:hypothetical protein